MRNKEKVAQSVSKETVDDIANRLTVNDTPLQEPNHDRVLKTYTFGGPSSGRDSRMFLHAIELEHLLHIAKSSKTNRVILHRAGLVVTVRQSRDGHVYEEIRIVCDQPVIEELPTGLKMNVTKAEAKRFVNAYGVKPSKVII